MPLIIMIYNNKWSKFKVRMRGENIIEKTWKRKKNQKEERKESIKKKKKNMKKKKKTKKKNEEKKIKNLNVYDIPR